MEYSQYAQNMYKTIVEEAPANHCNVLIHENGMLVDAGQNCLGGWMAAQMALEGLMGGRGQASFAHQPEGGLQIPVVEIFVDDPISFAEALRSNKQGICGVKNAHGYALGVYIGSENPAPWEKGNLVAAAPNSLFASVLEAGSVVAQAVWALQEAGVQDIQWGFSSCPLAPPWQNAQQRASHRAQLAAQQATISLWLRGAEPALRTVARNFMAVPLCLHELATACTYQNQLALRVQK